MIPCDETREALEEYRRRELPGDALRRVEAHLAGCPTCRQLRESDDALAALIRDLPRTPVPPALRRAIEELDGPRRGRASALARPLVAAVLSALVVAAALSPWVRFGSDGDPVERLIAAGVTEHKRILLQLQGSGGGEVRDASAAFATVRSLTGVELPRAFAGDDDIHLIAARPTLIVDRKTAAAVHRYGARSVTTYFALSGKGLPMPDQRRVQIEQYRPYMREINGFQVVYWKQGDLAYLMVTDLDAQEARHLFLRMRKAL